ncbi:MAG: hypothetical protein WCP28_06175, partial [Actinomycetes bacterium]
VPTWLVVIGYLFPIVLLFSPPSLTWVPALFPIWVLLLSIHILVVTRGRPGRDAAAWSAETP